MTERPVITFWKLYSFWLDSKNTNFSEILNTTTLPKENRIFITYILTTKNCHKRIFYLSSNIIVQTNSIQSITLRISWWTNYELSLHIFPQKVIIILFDKDLKRYLQVSHPWLCLLPIKNNIMKHDSVHFFTFFLWNLWKVHQRVIISFRIKRIYHISNTI